MKGDIGELMKQAREMQEKLQQSQAEIAAQEVQGQSGAGLVKIIMTGRYDVKRVLIDDLLLSEEKAVLEDLLAAAVNDAVKKVEDLNKNALGGMLPPGFKMPL